MSINRQTTVWCDGRVPAGVNARSTLTQTCHEWVQMSGNAQQVRSHARENGWRNSRRLGDLCPECVKREATPSVTRSHPGADKDPS